MLTSDANYNINCHAILSPIIGFAVPMFIASIIPL